MKTTEKKGLLLLVLLSVSSITMPEETEGFLTARLDTAGILLSRVRIKGRGSLLFVRLRSDMDGQIEGAAGLSTPVFSAGPVRLKGLLREIRRPGAYVTDSVVYSELPGVSLDASLDGIGNFGAALHTQEGNIGSLMLIETDRIGCSAWGTGGLKDFCSFHGYAELTTLYHESTAGDKWIAEEPGFSGREFLHLAGGVSLGPKHRYFSCALFTSFSPLSPSGYALRCSSKLLFSFLHLSMMLNLNGGGFVTPEGGSPKDSFTAGGEAVLFPDFILRPRAGYEKRVGGKKLFPVPFRCSSDRLEIGCNVETGPLSLYFGWEQEADFDSFGMLTGDDTFRLDAVLFREGALTLSFEPRLRRDTCGIHYLDLPLSFSVSGSRIRYRTSVLFNVKPEFSWKAALRITVKGKNREVFIKIEAEPELQRPLAGGYIFDRLYMQAGWESSSQFQD